MFTRSPSAAKEPISGHHSVKTSGGSPAAMLESSLAVLVVESLGMFVSVTWMSGCVALNSVTILLSSVSVVPDHIVHHVRLTTAWCLVTAGEFFELVAAAPPAPVAPMLTTPRRVTAASTTANLDLMRLFQSSRLERLPPARADAVMDSSTVVHICCSFSVCGVTITSRLFTRLQTWLPSENPRPACRSAGQARGRGPSSRAHGAGCPAVDRRSLG